MRQAIGIDIGGTKIAAGIVTDTGELQFRTEVKSDPFNKEAMFEKVVEAVEQVLENASISIGNVEGIGVGIPGKVDRKNGIAVYQNNLPWEGFPITVRLKQQFGAVPISIDNDVYMAAFAEWKHQQAKKDETFVYITISTGISCSIIHNGAFLRGAGFAGELGLLPILTESLSNKEYMRLESIAAGPAFEKKAKTNLRAEHITAKQVLDRYQQGQPQYEQIVHEITNHIAYGLYTISCLLDPHTIIFGGSVIVNNPFLLDLLKEKLANYQLSEQQHLLKRMSISELKQDNGVIGAGMRVLEKLVD